jgi:hypothetical protein
MFSARVGARPFHQITVAACGKSKSSCRSTNHAHLVELVWLVRFAFEGCWLIRHFTQGDNRMTVDLKSPTRRTTALVRGMVAVGVTLLLVGSCTNDHKNLTEPTKGFAHIPSFSSSSTTNSGASFTTDKDDYAPGETVSLSGSGWQPADVLDIHLTVDPPNHDPIDWTVSIDSLGDFTDGSYLVQDSDAGTTLTVTATSQATGESATATFTDNPCPGDLSAATSISPSLLAFTESGTTTRTYGLVTSNQNPSGGVPGVRELCVYHNGTTSSVAASYDSWIAEEPAGGATRIEFHHAPPLAESNNIPLDGSTVTVGHATYSAQPSSETIVAHISWASQCPVGNTCFKILSQKPAAVDLTVSKTASPSFDHVYKWNITKSVDKTLVEQVGGGTATFKYTVSVSHDDGTDGNWQVTGKITVTNPNSFDVTGINVADAVDDGGACTVTSGTNQTIAAGGSKSFDYSCTYSSAPSPQGGTNTATATWPDIGSPNTSGTGTATFDFGGVSPSLVDECMDVSDVFSGGAPDQQHTFCVGDQGESNNSFSFSYSRTIAVPLHDCKSYDNTASFKTNDTKTTGSKKVTVTVCGPATTGALTIGFWKTTNGQNLVKTYCANTLDDYLAGLGGGSGPFSDALGKNCSQLATYVFNVLSGASATDMNKMLKAQMLGTALDVWFSGPGWTSTKIGGTKPPSNFLSNNSLGTFNMDTKAVCPMVDNTTLGTATCLNNTPSTNAVASGAVPTSPMSMQAILDFAATTPSPFNGNTVSSVWYGGDRTKEEILKNIFDQFNNQMAFGSF